MVGRECTRRQAGYKDTGLNFDQSGTGRKRRRQRKTVWFNPPWSAAVEGNVAGWFNSLVDKHFKKGTLMGRLFNRNNLKVSYSCTKNVQAIISTKNRKLLQSGDRAKPTRTCNCRRGVECPAGGQCMEEGVVYEATISSENTEDRLYVGSTSSSLKARISNHACDFRLKKIEHATTMSSYVWGLKEQGEEPKVKFRILKKASPYTPAARRCALCIEEKVMIAKGEEGVSLNKKSEIAGKCRHRNKFLLAAHLDKG